jgi:hypothetical protein
MRVLHRRRGYSRIDVGGRSGKMKKFVDTKLNVHNAHFQHRNSIIGRMSVSHNFSIQLLQFADLFTELSAGFETQHAGEKLSNTASLEYRANITAAVFSAWSFVEATINEFFWAARENREALEGLSPGLITELGTAGPAPAVEEDLHQRTLEKYQKALEVTHKDLFSTGASPYQQAFLLSRLRNRLIHFEPEWVREKPQKLEKDLKAKFDPSPFYPSGSLFFPHRCLSHGCADWALKSALRFVDAFYDKICIKPKYESIRPSLNITDSKEHT